MARKKKKGKKKQDNVQTSVDHQYLNSHVNEELEALEAIFGDLYSLLSDGMGCKVSYVLNQPECVRHVFVEQSHEQNHS